MLMIPTVPLPDPLEREIRVHEQAIADLRQAQRDRRDARLLGAIYAAVSGSIFSARDLFDHAEVRVELAAALADFASPRVLGRRLGTLTNRVIGGWVLKLEIRDASGRVWALHPVPDAHGLWHGDPSDRIDDHM